MNIYPAPLSIHSHYSYYTKGFYTPVRFDLYSEC